MTTQALAATISFRQQMSVEQILGFAPQLSDYLLPKAPAITQSPAAARPLARAVSDSEHAFWTTFSFGCVQALILFCLVYSYFAH